MPISQLADESLAQETTVTIGGLITGVQRKVAKNGNAWAIVTVEDLEGAVEALFFAKTYTTHALNLVEDRVVVIRGRLDKREENLRFTALDMTMPDISAAPTGPLLITIEASRVTPPLVERMKEVLRSHPGAREVHLKLEDEKGGVVMKLDSALMVTASPSLSADLKQLLGASCLIN
jgi:DNA polymerase-3 subunit alpha